MFLSPFSRKKAKEQKRTGLDKTSIVNIAIFSRFGVYLMESYVIFALFTCFVYTLWISNV